jgi:hypothetical protein
MSRARHNFKLNDTTRLIRATVAAGHHVARVEHDPRTGRISVVTGAAEGAADGAKNGGEWDAAIEELQGAARPR